MTANGELGVRVDSQYSSDTVSIASSDDDQWGAQIGGYNENSAAYPPPPVGLMQHGFQSAESVAGSDLMAKLEVGFDDEPSPPGSRVQSQAPRYQLSDRSTQGTKGYAALSRSASPGLPVPRDHNISPVSPVRSTDGTSTAIGSDWKTHAKKRSVGRSQTQEYGPLGPLDPSARI